VVRASLKNDKKNRVAHQYTCSYGSLGIHTIRKEEILKRKAMNENQLVRSTLEMVAPCPLQSVANEVDWHRRSICMQSHEAATWYMHIGVAK
jgi:hypothetical protein